MKKCLAILLSLALLLPMMAVAGATGVTTINLWTFPVWSADGSFEAEIIAAFEAANPDVKVNLMTIDYQAGDDKLNAAIEAGTGPDILFETPQRLNKYGSMGKLIPLDDMFTADVIADFINPDVLANCGNGGHTWMYPLALTAHCMAINLEAWTDSGAIEFANLEGDRNWTNEDYVNAMTKLAEAGYLSTIIYCGGQGGDQGTRALVTNMFGAQFANPEHTEWTVGSPEGIKALELLKGLSDEGIISYDAGIVAGDEIQLFANGTVATSICWNAVSARNNAAVIEFTVEPLPFPSDDGIPVLEGGLYGFGIFDNKDDARADASKRFLEFVTHDSDWAAKSVLQTGFFPMFKSLGDLYADAPNPQTPSFAKFTKYLGDLFNIMPSFTEQRPMWWGMLQEIFSSAKTVEQALADYTVAANEAQAKYN